MKRLLLGCVLLMSLACFGQTGDVHHWFNDMQHQRTAGSDSRARAGDRQYYIINAPIASPPRLDIAPSVFPFCSICICPIWPQPWLEAP